MAGEQFGSAAWQQAQITKIKNKIAEGQKLSPADLAFLDVQGGHVAWLVRKAAEVSKNVGRDESVNEAIDFNTERWIKAILANDEASSDEELVKHFMEEGGLTEEEARAWVAKRQEYLTKIRPDDAAVSEAQGWAEKYSDAQLRTMLHELKAELSHADTAEKKADLEKRIAATKEEMKRRAMAMDERLIKVKKTYTSKEAKKILDEIDKLDKEIDQKETELSDQEDELLKGSKSAQSSIDELERVIDDLYDKRAELLDKIDKLPEASMGPISAAPLGEAVVDEANDASVDIAKAAILLANPNIKEPHTKRIEFLRSKGLTDQDIEQAIELATQGVKEGKLDEDWKKMLATGALAAVLLASPLADKAKAADADDVADLWNFLGTVSQTMSQNNPKYRKQGDVVVTTQNRQGVLADILGAITGRQTTQTMEDKLDDFLEANPNPTEAQINQFAYDNNYNVDVVKAKIYQWAAQRAQEYESIKEMCKAKGRLREMQIGGKTEDEPAPSEGKVPDLKSNPQELIKKLSEKYGLSEDVRISALNKIETLKQDFLTTMDYVIKDYDYDAGGMAELQKAKDAALQALQQVMATVTSVAGLKEDFEEEHGLGKGRKKPTKEAMDAHAEEEPAGTIADLDKRDDSLT